MKAVLCILTFDRLLTNAETDDEGNRVHYGQTPTNTWGLRKQHEQSIRKREFVKRIPKETKEYAENDTQQEKLNMSDKRLCYFQSRVFNLI
jgi:hypothetical protein